MFYDFLLFVLPTVALVRFQSLAFKRAFALAFLQVLTSARECEICVTKLRFTGVAARRQVSLKRGDVDGYSQRCVGEHTLRSPRRVRGCIALRLEKEALVGSIPTNGGTKMRDQSKQILR
jgi:hypothetical protein